MPKRKLSMKGITIVGNPAEVTLHEAMEAIADWLDYEADVVENAAEEITDPEIAEAAEDQAEAMREASDELEDAADAARETAAAVFTEGVGEPAADRVGDGSPEGEAIGGNPDELPIETNLPPETSPVPTDEPPRPLHWYKRPIGRRS